MIYVRVKAVTPFPWALLNEVAFPGTTLLLTDQPPGDWEFGFDEVDVDGLVSTRRPVITGTVPFDGPSGVASASFTP
jgi:hypothetical protein